MKNKISTNFIQSILFLVALTFCVSAQDFRQIQDGIEYANFNRQVKINEKETAPVVVNALRLDLSKVRLDVVHAMDAAIGVEKTSSIAARHGAIAAINAGFFRIDNSIFKGDAAGVLQIDGKLLSESLGGRIALGIINEKNKTEIVFGHLKTESWIGFSKDNVLFLSGINRERRQNEMILYKPAFHENALTDSEGTEVIFKTNCRTRKKFDSTEYCTAKVIEVHEQTGGSQIPANGYVVSVGKDAPENFKFFLSFVKKYSDSYLFRFGNNLILAELDKKAVFERAEDIVGGMPQLIKNSKIEITWKEEKAGEKFVTDRHPRTAIAKLRDGKALLITVDGRQPGISAGMNLQELAEMLLELGAGEAMNLDGGGSTTMFLDGKVVNRPSDKEGERAVSDAILVSLRKRGKRE